MITEFCSVACFCGDSSVPEFAAVFAFPKMVHFDWGKNLSGFAKSPINMAIFIGKVACNKFLR